MFLNGKDNDETCTTISGKTVISSCGGKIAFPINSLLDMAQNILATKSYCFLFFSSPCIAQARGLGIIQTLKQYSLHHSKRNDGGAGGDGNQFSSMHHAANKLTDFSQCFVLLPNVSPSCLMVTCVLKSETVSHPINRRNPKNSVNESISLYTTGKDTLHFKWFAT